MEINDEDGVREYCDQIHVSDPLLLTVARTHLHPQKGSVDNIREYSVLYLQLHDILYRYPVVHISTSNSASVADIRDITKVGLR